MKQMNKRQILFLIPVTLLLSSCALAALQGSGNVITESREVNNIEHVEVCCGMKLVLTQGEQEKLTIEAEDNVLPEIDTVVNEDRLVVRFHSNVRLLSLHLHRPVIVRLQMKTIHGVSISGGGSLETEHINTDHIMMDFNGGSHAMIGDLQAANTELVTSGGGSVMIDSLTADTLHVNANGGGHVTIHAGNVVEQQVTASGGSHYDALDVRCESARIDVGGGSNANVWVTETLNVRASGGSHVEYRGDPSIDHHLTGGSGLQAAHHAETP